jgi:molybdopterin biosynthesis enzyme
VLGAAFAGRPFEGVVGTGQCVRIMTGAMLPKGADAVLMQGPGSRRPRRPPGPADGAPGLRHPAFHERGRFFIVLPPDWGRVEPGTLVDVQPFFGLV